MIVIYAIGVTYDKLFAIAHLHKVMRVLLVGDRETICAYIEIRACQAFLRDGGSIELRDGDWMTHESITTDPGVAQVALGRMNTRQFIMFLGLFINFVDDDTTRSRQFDKLMRGIVAVLCTA